MTIFYRPRNRIAKSQKSSTKKEVRPSNKKTKENWKKLVSKKTNRNWKFLNQRIKIQRQQGKKKRKKFQSGTATWGELPQNSKMRDNRIRF